LEKKLFKRHKFIKIFFHTSLLVQVITMIYET
jgi:hypothetical protein